MSGLNTDLLHKSAPNFATTLTSSIISTDTSIILGEGPVDPLTGNPIEDTAIALYIDATDNNNNPTPAKAELVLGVWNNATLTLQNCLRGLDSTTAQGHTSGAKVVQWFTSTDWNELINNILAQHNQNGSHNAITADSVTINSFDIMRLVPVGCVLPFAGSVAPTNFLFCQGQAISRSSYATLFSAIGTTWGSGDGSTTFNIPDLRQKFLLGLAASGTGSVLGGTGGNIDHEHPLSDNGQANIVSVGNTFYERRISADTYTYNQTINGSGGANNSGSAPSPHGVGLSGTTDSANPPFAAMNMIIRY